MNNFTFIDEELDELSKKELRRELKIVLTGGGPWVELEGGKRVLQFASNNYLGLANHPEVINAAKSALSKYGTGSTGSRLLSGTTELHAKLEKALANFQGAKSSILFSSGYSASVGVLTAILSKEDCVYSDKLNHASIIDGIKLSRANKVIYKHKDFEHLESLVQENHKIFKKNVIITDTVFSMDGDVAPLEKIGLIAKKYDCITIVDEAHAIGVFGKNNSGLVNELGLEEYYPIKIATCSKALGVEGGFCTGSDNFIEYLRHKARSFMFSTSPSPMVVSAVVKSLELIQDGIWRKEKLWQNARLLHKGLKKNYKIKLSDLSCPIIPVFFNTINEALYVSNKLFNECHVWAPAIRPPSVNKPRIRLTPISTHSEDDINYLIKAFEFVSKDLSVEPLKLSV